MAKYFKLRTAVRVGVALVFLVLLAGVAEEARVGATRVTALPAAAAAGQANAPVVQVLKGKNALKLKGLSPELKGNFGKIERSFGSILKFASSVLEEEGIFYYFQHTGAQHEFETISDASARFLTVSDANAKFLPIGSSSSFVQGQGGLVSGAATLSSGGQQKLLSIPGIEVDVAAKGNGPSVSINNSTGQSLPAIEDQGGTDSSISLQPGSTSLTLTLQGGGVDQLHLQTFPAGGFKEVLTLIVSINSSPAQGSASFAGQLVNGAI